MIYTITIYGEPGVFEALPKERQDEVMSGHGALQSALSERGEFVSMKLMPPTSAVMVEPASTEGSAPLITDGPFAETKEQLGGFYLVDAADLDEACKLAAMVLEERLDKFPL